MEAEERAEALDLDQVERGIKGTDAVFPYQDVRAYYAMKDWAEKLLKAARAAESERAELAEKLRITENDYEAMFDQASELAREVERLTAVQRGTALESDERGARVNALAREVEELRGALRSLADYGPLEDTIRWNEMDSGHRSALMIARAALSEPTEGEEPARD